MQWRQVLNLLLASKLILPGLLQDANSLAVLGAFMLLGFMIRKLYMYILFEYLFILRWCYCIDLVWMCIPLINAYFMQIKSLPAEHNCPTTKLGSCPTEAWKSKILCINTTLLPCSEQHMQTEFHPCLIGLTSRRWIYHTNCSHRCKKGQQVDQELSGLEGAWNKGQTGRRWDVEGAKALGTFRRPASWLNQQKITMVLMRPLHLLHLKGESIDL